MDGALGDGKGAEVILKMVIHVILFGESNILNIQYIVLE